MYTPLNPAFCIYLLYLFSSFFAPKHRLWVLTIYVLSKNKKNIKIFQLKIFNFQSSKNLCLLNGQVFVMQIITTSEFPKASFLFIGSFQLIVEMSRLMGIPTICIGENKGADQLRGNREADQRLCFRYSDSTIPSLFNFKIPSF